MSIDEVKMEINYIKDKLEKIPTRQEMELANEKLVERVLNKCDDRYASKLTERIVFAMAGAILLGVVYAILKFVIK